jgi:hypothetical protein
MIKLQLTKIQGQVLLIHSAPYMIKSMENCLGAKKPPHHDVMPNSNLGLVGLRVTICMEERPGIALFFCGNVIFCYLMLGFFICKVRMVQ